MTTRLDNDQEFLRMRKASTNYSPESLSDLAYYAHSVALNIHEQEVEPLLQQHRSSEASALQEEEREIREIALYYREAAYWESVRAGRPAYQTAPLAFWVYLSYVSMYTGRFPNAIQKRAYHYLEEAASAGNKRTDARYYLGCYHLNITAECSRDLWYERNPALGVKYLEEASAAEDDTGAWACMRLARAHRDGTGTYPDARKAIPHAERANRRRTDPQWMYELGKLYESACDYDRAGTWLEKAAAAGSTRAQGALTKYRKSMTGTWKLAR